MSHQGTQQTAQVEAQCCLEQALSHWSPFLCFLPKTIRCVFFKFTMSQFCLYKSSVDWASEQRASIACSAVSTLVYRVVSSAYIYMDSCLPVFGRSFICSVVRLRLSTIVSVSWEKHRVSTFTCLTCMGFFVQFWQAPVGLPLGFPCCEISPTVDL